MDDDSSNARVLHLKPKKGNKGPVRDEAEGGSPFDFSGLTQKLEERIDKIEIDIKESIEILENDLHKVIRSKKFSKVEEKKIHEEITGLAGQLENRIHKTLEILSLRQNKLKNDSDSIELIKKLSARLVKVLSFDFYKSVLNRLGSAEFTEEVDPFGMDRHLITRIKPFFDYLYYKYWRITTTGIENIPNEGRALIVGNHSGTVPYDGAMIKTAILNEHPDRKDCRFLVEDFVYHMPFLGTFMYRIGGVRACPENAEYLLNAEHLVIVFPEGVKGIGKFFSNRYKLQRFGRGGFIKLCMKTKSPLIPVGVVGAEEIHPIIFKSNILAKTMGLPYIPITPTFPLMGLLGLIPFPSKWSIHFGKPMDMSAYAPQAIGDELLIHELSEKVRNTIQEIICDLLKNRRSVWWG